VRLYLDVGNTRAKWLLIRADQSSLDGLVNTEDFTALASQVDESAKNETLDGVFVSSVAGAATNDRIGAWVCNSYDLTPVFAEVEKCAFGVTVAYENIRNLGVDRWLALVAGRAGAPESQIIVDAGSALTVDYLSANGQHLGGFIVPGVNMMIGALFDRTDAVKVSAELSGADLLPGRDTAGCVRNGTLVILKGFLEKVWQIGRQINCDERFVLTGGDAGSLISLCEGFNVVVDPNLVFTGLKVYSDEYRLTNAQY